MLTTCRNAVSIVGLLVKAIYSVAFTSAFSSWIAAGAWGCYVISAVADTSHKWDREEDFVMDFVPGETTRLLPV